MSEFMNAVAWQFFRSRKHVALICFICCVVIFYNVPNSSHRISLSISRDAAKRTTPISPECVCEYEGRKYDFCYHLPENDTVLGKRFSCDFAPVLDKFGLLEDEGYPLNRDGYLDLEKADIPTPVMVSAFSDNHFHEGKRLISKIRRYWPQQKLIVYDLGLSDSNVDLLKGLCNTEYRKFNFSAYPSYFQHLSEFRWKPLIIAETLSEYGAVWYMDSSVVFKKGNLSHVYDLVRCKKELGNKDAQPPLLSIAERDERERITKHEDGWDQAQWLQSISECRKSSYLFHGYTGHGIFPATDPGVYLYIPTNMEEIKKPKAKMYEAGFIFAVRTAETVNNILRWYVMCALEKDCMSGNASLACSFDSKDRFSVYAHCHRFDQSVANLLAANAYFYDRHYYVSEIVDFFNIIRGAEAVDGSLLWCNGTAAE